MDKNNIISIAKFCEVYDVPGTFIDSLYNFDLIEIVETNNERFINMEQIKAIEKMMRLHFDLNINLEGIDVINNLLNEIDELKKEVVFLKNKLAFYE